MPDAASRTFTEPEEIVVRFRSRAEGLRRKHLQAFNDIRRTLERIAPDQVDVPAHYQDSTYVDWLAEAEMLEADADTIESLQAEVKRLVYPMQRALAQLRWARTFQPKDRRGGTDEAIELLQEALRGR